MRISGEFRTKFLVFSHPSKFGPSPTSTVLLTPNHSLLLTSRFDWASPCNNTDFPPSIRLLYIRWSVWLLGFVTICTLTSNGLPEKVSVRRTRSLLGTSFSLLLTAPWEKLNSFHQQPSSGLSPYSKCPCQAHKFMIYLWNWKCNKTYGIPSFSYGKC